MNTIFDAFILFFERYIVGQGLPTSPKDFLARPAPGQAPLPNFYETACPQSENGIACNTVIHEFLNFVLLMEFSREDAYGQPVVSPGFFNPVPRRTRSGILRHGESVYSPLPYGYIDELRTMIAQGPHFQDWKWAQNVLGVNIGMGGRGSPDWFRVTADKIDPNDPDCVWRERTAAYWPINDNTRLEMWSPVRWVALLVKLIVPLRTHQVRMLDSGEADTWRYETGVWTLNKGQLAQGNERRPVRQGVFRSSEPPVSGKISRPMLYINTNKTKDIGLSGSDLGYVMPWIINMPVEQNIFYWLEKLRNWQEKFNPIKRRTSWTELDIRHIPPKSEVQLAAYPATCFLFRMPELPEGERNLPIAKNILNPPWFHLLKALQQRVSDRGEKFSNGAPIQFLPPEPKKITSTTLYPLHSLRVSLITALALDGQLEFPILQKVVGHSRLLMTLYYTKPSALDAVEKLDESFMRIQEKMEVSILNFLQNIEHGEIKSHVICNCPDSLAKAIPQHPAARNPLGWMPMHHGLCVVGGDASAYENNHAIGGCYNGGSLIIGTDPKAPKYIPVPGGSRNCVRCRWFVTAPGYLLALRAHCNTLAYHFDEARNALLAQTEKYEDLKNKRADAEVAGELFTRFDELRHVERVYEKAVSTFDDRTQDVAACFRLINRCVQAYNKGNGKEMVAVGTEGDLKAAFVEMESELLHVALVNENAEIYADENQGKATLRLSQLLDVALDLDNIRPVFSKLSEEEQKTYANAFLRQFGQMVNPEKPVLGKLQAIQMMNAKKPLGQLLGIDLSEVLALAKNFVQAVPVPIKALMEMKYEHERNN
ncbi:MAG: integrase [Candidatus Riflebacteria bacterium]|nr:integrase [Candidatus Riflebacteria bacterium]